MSKINKPVPAPEARGNGAGLLQEVSAPPTDLSESPPSPRQRRGVLRAGNKNKRQFSGVVVSDKMQKTVVVRVDRVRLHPKYKKRYGISRKYKVHDESGAAKTGDKVIFEECRPLSKDKRWRLV